MLLSYLSNELLTEDRSDRNLCSFQVLCLLIGTL